MSPSTEPPSIVSPTSEPPSTSIPSPTRSPTEWNGECVKDCSPRLLPTLVNVPSLTPATCIQACQEKGFSFAGVQWAKECWCGHTSPPADKIVDQKECNMKCAGDSASKCGGSCRMGVFSTSGRISLLLVGLI